ncbi:three-Cys-motif partner protein TcmP [Patescibacteria group bacterium]|nr:three-Cys-motif partner protein TcmP [Patescibacteria group bacterium]MBU2220154.1 three-Cys-motif partner protein TcmP [Patescibacteria group bacterium]
MRSIKEEFKQTSIEIFEGDCNEILVKKLITLFPYDSFRRALLFLDPFGMNINWSVIAKSAQPKTIEIILNMPIMAMNRACLLNNPDNLTKRNIEMMNSLWGNDDWQKIVYSTVLTLFGTAKMKNCIDSKELSNYFVQRLKLVFGHVSRPLIMRNSKNSPLYCLIYAGHNKIAKNIIESIFGHFEKLNSGIVRR